MISSIIQVLFKLKFRLIWRSKKRNDKEPIVCLTSKPRQSFFAYRTQQRIIFFTEKEFLINNESGRLNQKRKEGFLTVFAEAIKKGPTTKIRKHANKFKVQEKTVRTAIKQHLILDLNYVWENETNATSHPNIGSLKTATYEKWNKMSEEFIPKTC